jgi:bifunctional DNA-binding transcriptional regulator/antitoxin component of YhaV-PrlF toxin-antitoxin module
MAETSAIMLQDNGMIILPEEIRRRYHLQPGDLLTLTDTGRVLLLTPRYQPEDPSGGAAADPQFLGKLKSIQEMLEDL